MARITTTSCTVLITDGHEFIYGIQYSLCHGNICNSFNKYSELVVKAAKYMRQS